MFGPEWSEGCKSCSFWADNFNNTIVHLNQRDVTMVAISKAPLEKLTAFQKRMGWTFKWLSSFGNDFNRDYHVSFTPEELEKGAMYYNYRIGKFGRDEAPGLSVFYKNAERDSVSHVFLLRARARYVKRHISPSGRTTKGTR